MKNPQQSKTGFQDQCQALKSTFTLKEKDSTTTWLNIINQKETIVKIHSFSQQLLILGQITLIIEREKWNKVWTFLEKAQSEKSEFQVVHDTSSLMSTDQFQESLPHLQQFNNIEIACLP